MHNTLPLDTKSVLILVRCECSARRETSIIGPCTKEKALKINVSRRMEDSRKTTEKAAKPGTAVPAKKKSSGSKVNRKSAKGKGE